MQNNKIIYLDIDGCLNTDLGISEYYKKTKKNDYIDPLMAANLTKLCDLVPDAKIVISSMWRGYFTLQQMRKYLKPYVDPKRIIDMTPLAKWNDWDYPDRGTVIAKHMEIFPNVESYVVIDDFNDGISNLHSKNFIYVNPITGLTEDDVIEAARILNKTP
jgi:hypothetical protein